MPHGRRFRPSPERPLPLAACIRSGSLVLASRTLVLLAASSLACGFLASGCASTVPISELSSEQRLDIELRASVRVVTPGRQLKFTVDVTNLSDHVLDLADLKIEIQVRGPAGAIQLRQDWKYAWGRDMLLRREKRITLPIVPERGLELPLDQLAEGTYNLVAVINGRFSSRPCPVQVLRPDLTPRLRPA
jgi:hypothetical protein